MKFSFSILLIFLFVVTSSAQEYTNSLRGNPQIRNFIKKNPAYKKNKSKAVLELPFWDDFSDSYIYPKSDLWQDDAAYINNTLAVNPPSIGVATLDAVDSEGKIYDRADYNTSFLADSLTSQPINLNYPGNSTIFLSFYYQPQGIGDAPEPSDSLFLEFYAPNENTWTEVWSVAGSDNKDFTLVVLPINQAKFLKDSFQFRFRNYASFGASTYPSLATNCDFWHIDYVYLNKNRNAADTVFHDIAFTKPLHSLLSNYEAVPWKHFKETNSQTLKSNITVNFKNNDNIMRLIDSLNFTLEDLTGTSAKQYWYGGTYTPVKFLESNVNLSGQPFNFPENNSNTSKFKLTARIVTDSYDSTQNNTVSYIQSFDNFYAYDDGSAEAGYGIYGNGTKYGQVALKFSPLKNDYLTGVDMYFTRAFKDASQKYFWIYLWKVDSNGLPGDTIRTYEGILPEYENEINKFHQYIFDKPVLIDGDFFIGWTQTTEDKLNIGFDYNTINNDKVFYNISGEWIPSAEKGSLMIHPIFGSIQSSVQKINKESLKIFPNPATDYITIDFDRNHQNNYSIEIYNIQGTRVFYQTNFNQNTLSIQNLKKGIYFVRLNDNHSKIYSTKFIKN
ncbi:MAG: T9SS type A sorting domain-containing protein [Chlorobi bacterium]|nr:T9SS type A sorting domain-containing protein [Chlorobiota bacterium]